VAWVAGLSGSSKALREPRQEVVVTTLRDELCTRLFEPGLPWVFAAASSARGLAGAKGDASGANKVAAVENVLGDLDLVERVRNGDGTAFRGLVERYQGRVFALVFGMLRNREDALDVTQDTFIKAFRNLGTFRGDSSFHTWLFRIGMNLAIDLIRSHGRSRVGEYNDAVAVEEEGDVEWTPDHLRRSPGKDLERQELYGRIMDAMQQLPPDHREVILLREIEGLSYKEIAEAMDIPEGTVMSRLFYARKRLQALLQDLR
jgi:RNA polymerase sigma-70 factor, ECF subfamily